ncbi:MAG: chemotaxis-specific protein-glutamate methyltransferase CheB [Actinomycetota bacterium]
MRRKATVLLVDDSMVLRQALRKVIDRSDDLRVIDTASHGRSGVEKVRSLEPDLVFLDVEMPVMNGLEALAEIRASHPKLPVIMFSTLTSEGAEVTLDALALGASDYAVKPKTSGIAESVRLVERDLLTKARALLGLGRPTGSAGPTTLAPAPTIGRPSAVVVGCSTGGPTALKTVLDAIRRPLPVPMFVVQHMPATFTAIHAERLDQTTATTVVEATHGMSALPGHCYIAPGDRHMILRRTAGRIVISLSDSPPVNYCRPAVDPLFLSADPAYGGNVLAVMLTGMGHDGLDGTRAIARSGGMVIVQDEATSAVWGMPGAVATAGLANEVLPIQRIGGRLISLCQPMSAGALTR